MENDLISLKWIIFIGKLKEFLWNHSDVKSVKAKHFKIAKTLIKFSSKPSMNIKKILKVSMKTKWFKCAMFI